MSATFLQHFEMITDPRVERCKRHELMDILLLAICAVISGATGWEDIEDFGKTKLTWLRQYRPFESGIPRHDTIARVIYRLKPSESETAFRRWIGTLIDTIGCGIIAVDGKTVRRSFRTQDRAHPLHAVSAWSCQHQRVLGVGTVSIPKWAVVRAY